MPDTPTVQTVTLSELVVDEEQNPRGAVSAADVAELTKSVALHGVLQPVLVESANGNGYSLVAGFRRVVAAREAGLEEIPVYVREAGEDRLTFALSENLPGLREDMDPVAEAKAIDTISNGGKVNRRALAKRLGKSEGFVRERLRLLELPERAQELVAAGKVPVGVTAELAKIAEVSAKLASRVSEEVAKDAELAREFGRDPATVIHSVVETDQAELEVPPSPGKLAAVDVGWSVDVADHLPASEEQRTELLGRLEEIRGADHYGGTSVRLEEQDHDALRALGVLVEVEGPREWSTTQRFCTDDEALRDVVAQVIEREAKAAEKRLKAERKEHEKAAKELAKQTGKEPEQIDPEEVERERRRSVREERKAEQEAARTANLELGHKLLRRKTRKVSQKRQLERAKAVARIAILSDENLAARGLRLTREGWQEVETVTYKNGNSREKVTYAERDEANGLLLEEIDKAAGVEAVLELVTEALIAATYADEKELPGSQHCWGPGFTSDRAVEETIDQEANGALPEAMKAKARDRQEMRVAAAA